jgi:DNA-binding NtrC family response regulator
VGERESILVVDDDATLLDLLKSGLTSEDYDCETVTNAAAALEVIHQNSHGIMITDIDMPDMNGLELTKKAKTVNPHVKVVIMTGFIDKFSYDKAIEAGASDFIRKPFSLKELTIRIKHIRMQEELRRSRKELEKRVKELEEFYNMAIGRELRMIELKAKIEELEKELEKYKTL